jgi:beta-mannosidase
VRKPIIITERRKAMEQRLDLNGIWSYYPDPDGRRKPDTLPDAGWESMAIPNNWQLAGLDNYSGVVWFRRKFEVPQDWQERELWLTFTAVDYFADVWLNGHYVGHHEGYFQPFEFHINQYTKPGANELLVRVDAPFEEPGPDGWPTKKRIIKGVLSHWDGRPGSSDPEHGQDMGCGGIWNDVFLVAARKVRITRAQVVPLLLTNAATVTINLWIENIGGPADAGIVVDIAPANFEAGDQTFQLKRNLRLNPGENVVTLTQTVPDPHLWSTWDYGRPNLYQLTATAEVEGEAVSRRSDRFGIRTIHVTDDWRFFLNGRQIFIRGTNVIPTLWLGEYDEAMIARDIQQLRDANVNGVRVCVHVNRKEFYAACDEAGILIWNDFALQWSYDDTDDFKANAVEQIRDFVRMLYNHPSIIVWACQNEPLGNRITLTPLLAAAVAEEDSTRHIVPAATFDQHTYNGWYYGTMAEYVSVPAAPFCNEYGAQALPNLETLQSMLDESELWPTTQEHWKKWAYHDFQYDQTFNVAGIQRGENVETFIANSQAYQYDLLKLSTEIYRQNKYSKMNSVFQFMFMDAWPSITWSVVDYYRRPKIGYEALRLAFQPVLVSFNKGRTPPRAIQIGSIFGILLLTGITVVNDLHREFAAARVVLSVELPDSTRDQVAEKTLDVPADGVVSTPDPLTALEADADAEFQQFLGMMAMKLAQLTPGVHRLVLELFDADGNKLSENYEDFEFVAPVAPTPSPF